MRLKTPTFLINNNSLIVIGSLIIFLCNCSLNTERSIEEIQNSGKLIVLTRNAPTTYYFDSNDQVTGPEYEMAESFARFLGIKTEYKVFHTVDKILQALKKGEGDFAAAGIPKTAIKDSPFLFGPAYQKVQQQVVCRNGVKHVKKVDDLTSIRFVVPKSSSYEETLNHFKKKSPDLDWESSSTLNSEQLFEKVRKAEIDCTAANSNITSINRRYFPKLIVPFELKEAEHLAWVLGPKNQDLQNVLEEWFEEFKSNGELDQIRERYFGYIKKFDFVDTTIFHKAIEEKYPKYKRQFEKAAKQYNLDKLLLAAHSYQESHWNPRAKSPTGVRGIMMLTLPTAKSLGVKSRLNPDENIMAGAKHFSNLLKTFNKEVKKPDRTWLALAAYNVGRGHLHDAQELARRMNKNPHLWSDLKKVLPLLSNKKYYKTLKYGYARGREPVKYVQRIRNYRDILANKLAPPKLATPDKFD